MRFSSFKEIDISRNDLTCNFPYSVNFGWHLLKLDSPTANICMSSSDKSKLSSVVCRARMPPYKFTNTNEEKMFHYSSLFL